MTTMSLTRSVDTFSTFTFLYKINYFLNQIFCKLNSLYHKYPIDTNNLPLSDNFFEQLGLASGTSNFSLSSSSSRITILDVCGLTKTNYELYFFIHCTILHLW